MMSVVDPMSEPCPACKAPPHVHCDCSWDEWERARLTAPKSMAMVRSCTSRSIDLNGQTAPATAHPLTHYVIVRADLPIGSKVAQAVHAAGESASPRPKPGTYAVALQDLPNFTIEQIAQRLFEAGIEHHCVFEADDDPKYPGQLMAIGLYPTRDRDKVKKVLSSLPLIK